MIAVVDVFAGPGGLNEGFGSARSAHGEPIFDVVGSFEMEPNAVATLTLRAALRSLPQGTSFTPYRDLLRGRCSLDDLRRDPSMAVALERAGAHVHQIELGPAHRQGVRDRIATSLRGSRDWVLIGGPPCQAYSLVGRARRSHDPLFSEDKKHFLYREYLDIIKGHRPAVFVMENVKGLLSAGHGQHSMFDLIQEDLRDEGRYEVRSLVVGCDQPTPGDFVIESERYGIPQRRHRVILLGIRRDLAGQTVTPLSPRREVTVRAAIGSLPRVRSLVSRASQRESDWEQALALGAGQGHLDRERWGRANSATQAPVLKNMPTELRSWIEAGGPPISQHEPRSHMPSDLARYAYLATMAEWGWSPRVDELPNGLQPEHRNLAHASTPFVDRFKVQTWDRPSSTIASHISKDGHYYIHPDPSQMRSLTVREAARLQTFPDDYYFCGSRTMQYHQVGNAVPPFLAHQIAMKVAELLGEG
jgi:DNA (cytosine-5)-methyltransferase 1